MAAHYRHEGALLAIRFLPGDEYDAFAV